MKYTMKNGYLYVGIGIFWLIGASILINQIGKGQYYFLALILNVFPPIVYICNGLSRLLGINFLLITEDSISIKRLFRKTKSIKIKDINSIKIVERYATDTLIISNDSKHLYIRNNWKINIYDLKSKLENIQKNDTIK